MSLPSVLWYLIVATALAGGALSLAAYHARSRGPAGGSNRLYLVSYILMSVSIALFAVAGLMR